MTSSQIHIGCYIVRSVLGSSAGKQFQSEVERLLRNNGPEWVCGRLKAIYTASLHLRNGDGESAKKIYQENSISYHKRDMTPKGAFRPAVIGLIHAQRPAAIRQFSAVLRFYTALTLPSLSDKQLQKAKGAIEDPSPRDDSWYQGKGKECVQDAMTEIGGLFYHVSNVEQFGQTWRPKADDLDAKHLRATSHYYQAGFRLPREYRNEPYASMCLSLMANAYVPQPLDTRTPCFEMRNYLREQDPSWDLKPVGRITALQEPGCKARVVCMPSAWLQLAFQPLHRQFQRLAESYFPGESRVFNQTIGANLVARELEKPSSEVTCYDLSSATDRFPLSFQTQIMRMMGYKDYADALEDVTNKTFESPWGLTQYGSGQPMGLYGSFAVFHFCHLITCKAAEHRAKAKCEASPRKDLKRFNNGSCFQVLGDDVVFSDYSVAEEYRAIIDDLDVPISEQKSFRGNVAEFAGFTIFRTNKGTAVQRPYKYPKAAFVTNPISLLDAVGHRMAKGSAFWKKQYQLYNSTRMNRDIDLSPLYPEEGVNGPNPYRADGHTMVVLANSLTSVIPGLPDLSGSTRINTVPLFLERGPLDHYGYNPDQLKSREGQRYDLPFRETSRRLNQDPLIKQEIRRRESTNSQPVGYRAEDVPKGQAYPTSSPREVVPDKSTSFASRLRLVMSDRADFESQQRNLETQEEIVSPVKSEEGKVTPQGDSAPTSVAEFGSDLADCEIQDWIQQVYQDRPVSEMSSNEPKTVYHKGDLNGPTV